MAGEVAIAKTCRHINGGASAAISFQYLLRGSLFLTG
jgi:hypothetical protein